MLLLSSSLKLGIAIRSAVHGVETWG